MALMTQNSLSFVFDEVVSSIAYASFNEDQMLLPVVYGMRTSSKRRERGASIGALGDWDEKTEGQEPSEDVMTQQFRKDFVHVAYGKQVPVSREVVDDEDWGFLQELGMEIGRTAQEKMEKLAAAPFNDAFAGASYTAEDGLSICNDAHLNADGGNSQDNSGTTALSLAALGSTRKIMRQFTNDRGDKSNIRPTALMVPLNKEQKGWELLNSTGQPEGANNEGNFFSGLGWSLIVWDYLTDDDNWFMLDLMKLRMQLLWYQRISLEIFGEGNLFAGKRRIGGYFRASHGLKDWRPIYGHNV